MRRNRGELRLRFARAATDEVLGFLVAVLFFVVLLVFAVLLFCDEDGVED
jgi:hypothetical protein